MLRRLAFVFVRTSQIRYQCHVNKERVIRANLQSDLSDCLQERLAFNISGRAADFRDDHVRVGRASDIVDKRFDFIGNMGNYLYGFAEIFAPALLVQHIPVHLAGGQVGKPIQVFIDEAFIMPEVQVGFRAVLGDEYLAMLIRTHRPGVYIDIGV